MNRLSVLCATAALMASPLAFAQSADRLSGHDHARHAAEAARVDPVRRANSASIDTILADAQRRYPGEVIDVSYDDGEYDIDIRQANGQRVELDYSARTGRLLKTDHD